MQVNRPEDINNAKRLIFPGVGSFKSAMEVLNAKGYILTSISWACDFIGFATDVVIFIQASTFDWLLSLVEVLKMPYKYESVRFLEILHLML